jgi:chemotaxis protein MotB
MKTKRKFTLAITLAGFVLLGFCSCKDKDAALIEENKRLRALIEKHEGEKARLETQIEELNKKNELLRLEFESTQKRAFEMQAELASRKITSEYFNVTPSGDIILQDVLFVPGGAEIGEKGKEALRELASILIERNENIRVDGHTDSDVVSKSKDKWNSNWELSAIRAARVVEAFEKFGVAAERLSIAAFGEHRAVASNETETGKRKNRRVEIRFYNTVPESND